jgi:hypothetical protein
MYLMDVNVTSCSAVDRYQQSTTRLHGVISENIFTQGHMLASQHYFLYIIYVLASATLKMEAAGSLMLVPIYETTQDHVQ